MGIVFKKLSGLNIKLPPVSDVAVDASGVLTFTASDTSALTEYNPVVSYLVKVNETELTTTETTLDLSSYLEEGENTIIVTAKAVLSINTSSEQETIQVEYSSEPTIVVLEKIMSIYDYFLKVALVGTDIYIFGGDTVTDEIYKFDTTTETITTLTTKLPSARKDYGGCSVGTNIYFFGGNNSSGYLSEILKFDTTTETITTLSATLPSGYKVHYGTHLVGNDIYISGVMTNLYKTTMFKFDTTTETITTLSATLPNENMCAAATQVVGNTIYFFGGGSNAIRKFDIENGTFTTIETTLPTATNYHGSALVGNNIYLFGGETPYSSEILKFDTTTETITTLDITLPINMSRMGAVTLGNTVYMITGMCSHNNSYTNGIYKITNL